MTAANTSVCRYIRQWISVLRRQMTVAITTDELLKKLNGYLRDVGYGRLERVTEDELKQCLKHISTVEIITKSGKEVVWLWGSRLRRRLLNMIIDIVIQEGEVNVC
jgi:hypothetical protein